MKVAVTYENGNVYQHFGHTENFKFYEIEEGKVLSSNVVNTAGSGHGALAGFLKENSVDTLICGGIGAGAQQALSQAGIKYYAGVQGNADEAVSNFLNNTLEYDPDAVCSHHEHHHDDSCHSNCHNGKCSE